MARRKRLADVAVDLLISEIAEQISTQIDRDLGDLIKYWGDASNRNITQRKGVRAINAVIAEEARRATYQSYVSSGLGKNPSYRFNDRRQWRRYSNGKMEMALLDPATIKYDRDGVYLFNKDNLDKYAAQWYRLNFGTKSGRDKTIAPMEFFGVTLKSSPTLASFKLSPAFSMPSGIWSSTFKATTLGPEQFDAPSGTENAFYAIGARKKRPKTGNGKLVGGRKSRAVNQIVGKSFLDRGVEAMNQRYPDLIGPLVASWVKEIKRK